MANEATATRQKQDPGESEANSRQSEGDPSQPAEARPAVGAIRGS